jgi:hypothetical protein
MIFNGKMIFLFLCVMGLSINSFAQDGNSTDVKRFSFGGLVSMLPDRGDSAGNLEFGFLLFYNETCDIRNHIYINGTRIHDDDGGGRKMLFTK